MEGKLQEFISLTGADPEHARDMLEGMCIDLCNSMFGCICQFWVKFNTSDKLIIMIMFSFCMSTNRYLYNEKLIIIIIII